MVEIDDIKDQASLKAWLKTQPNRTSVVIAHRAAMRVLPAYLHWELTSIVTSANIDRILSFLRGSLISGVAAYYPTLKLQSQLVGQAALAASQALTYEAAVTVKYAAQVAGISFTSGGNSGGSSKVIDLSTSAADVNGSIVFSQMSDFDVWKMVRNDCTEIANGRTLDQVKLWHRETSSYAKTWWQNKPRLQNDPID